MDIPIRQIDAFAERPFEGNPAAVCLLPRWLPPATLQAVAAENNLSETAFLVAEGEGYRLRWFTPAVEVDLCGHATLAAGYVVLGELEPDGEVAVFATRSGRLEVRRTDGGFAMDFPSIPTARCAPPPGLAEALGVQPFEVFSSPGHYMAVLGDPAAVEHLRPDIGRLAALDRDGVIVTAAAAPGSDHDIVSRYFAPKKGVPEDPVTGSAHCVLAPFWAERLARPEIRARQASRRGGRLTCRPEDGRVILTGRAVPFLAGTIRLPEPA